MVKKREPYFDLVRFVAMFFVVYGHAFQVVQDTTQLSRFSNFIVGLNMPLFFFVCGYFSRNMIEVLDGRKLCRRLVVYFWPVVFFSVVSVCLLAIRNGGLTWTYAFNRLLLYILRGWFFYALAACEALTFFVVWVTRTLHVDRALVLVAVLVGLFVLPRGVWHVTGTLATIPFYWLGLWGLKEVMDNRWRIVGIGIVCLVGYLIVCLLGGNFWQNGLAFYGHRFVMLSPDAHEFMLTFARYGIGLMGVVGVLGVMKLICLFAPIVRISWLGEVTLGVYFFHRYFLAWWAKLCPWNSEVFFLLAVTVGVYLISSYCFIFSKKYKILRLMMWGPY